VFLALSCVLGEIKRLRHTYSNGENASSISQQNTQAHIGSYSQVNPHKKTSSSTSLKIIKYFYENTHFSLKLKHLNYLKLN
jgi:hypothetical protein